MKIEYLTKLRDNPKIYPLHRIEGIAIDEIKDLENLYNNGNQFPKSLTELLFLSGKYSYTFDYGITDSQKEIQQMFREELEETGKIISRAYYVIETYGSQFFFVYLDEGNDPQIYQANPWSSSEVWISNVSDHTIKSFVELDIANNKAYRIVLFADKVRKIYKKFTNFFFFNKEKGSQRF